MRATKVPWPVWPSWAWSSWWRCWRGSPFRRAPGIPWPSRCSTRCPTWRICWAPTCWGATLLRGWSMGGAVRYLGGGGGIGVGVGYGGGVSLLVGVVSTAVATLIGITIGALAGYHGGRLDDVLMRLTEFFQTI